MNYDSFVRLIANDTLQYWKKQWLRKTSGPLKFEEEYELDRVVSLKENPLEFDYEATLMVIPTEEGIYKVDGHADAGRKYGKDKGPGWICIEFQIDPQDLPQSWEEIAMDLRDVIRHEIEHLLQEGWSVKKSKRIRDDTIARLLIDLNIIPKVQYFLLKKEVDAMLYGMYLKAKKCHKPFHEIVRAYLNMQPLSESDIELILQTWDKRSKQLSLPSPLSYEAA